MARHQWERHRSTARWRWVRHVPVHAIRKLVASVVGALAAALIVRSLPDLARYLKIREM